MRFNSKSLLSTIQMSHLEFTCRNIADWAAANGLRRHDLPDTLPIEFLGGGNYGICYRLRDYPGLVIKLCNDGYDGYPEYIRQVAKLRRPKSWMPRVFMYGGDECVRGMEGVFWCVLPEYENPWGHDSSWCIPWGNEGTWILDAGNVASAPWLSPKERVHQLRRDVKNRRDRKYAVQLMRFLSPMNAAGGRVYLHAKNALKDGERWIITDPIAGWSRDDKECFRNAHS